jgi:hypothetical protein
MDPEPGGPKTCGSGSSTFVKGSPDIFLPVLRTESQILIQSRPHIIAVQAVGRYSLRHQILLQGKGERGLARPRQAGEPDGAAAESAGGALHLTAAVPRDGVLLEGDVGRLLDVPGAARGDRLLFKLGALGRGPLRLKARSS